MSADLITYLTPMLYEIIDHSVGEHGVIPGSKGLYGTRYGLCRHLFGSTEEREAWIADNPGKTQLQSLDRRWSWRLLAETLSIGTTTVHPGARSILEGSRA